MMCQALLTKLKSITVEPVLFFYMMLIFLESNALQELIAVKSCLKIYKPENASFCSNKTVFNDTVNEEKAYWAGFNGGALFFFTFLSSFFVASWSDKFGRKFPMLIPLLGTTIAASVNCTLSTFMRSDVIYILISSSISGLTFGTVGIVASTFGFITDISEESARTKKMMILEAMIFIGGTVGIYVAKVFLHDPDYSLTWNGFSQLFLFEVTVAVTIAVYVIIRIPSRSNNSAEESVISWRSLFSLNHFKSTLRAVFRARDAGKRKIVLLLSLALFFIYFGLVVQFTLTYYFLKDTLHWDFSKYSVYNALQFAVEGLILIIGMPVFLRFLKISDHLIAALGIVSKMTGFIMFGLSKSDYLVYSCIACFMFSEYPVPAIRSMLSKIVDADEKGRIFAFTTMVQNFCFLIGALLLTTIYKETLEVFPGLCFEIVAGLQAIALIIILYLYFTKGEIITTYEVMENEDGTVEETCSITKSTQSND